jgi:RNA polymerase sigma-70 factor (ECF subfamily)
VIRAAIDLLRAAPVAEADPRLDALRAGDAAVIEQVLTELLPPVRRWVFRSLGPDSELDDVVQEALTEIALSLGSYQGRSSLAAYAYRICARVVARHLKHLQRTRSQRRMLARQSPVTRDARDPERLALQREALRPVLRALQKLPSRRREAFVLCELEGMSAEEAAGLSGTSADAMRSRLMHARKEMARLLQTGRASSGYPEGEVP